MMYFLIGLASLLVGVALGRWTARRQMPAHLSRIELNSIVMDDQAKQVYLGEVQTQCEFALNAIKGLHSVLARLPEAAMAGDYQRSSTLQREVFRSIHSFLTHASNISRLLWPAPPRRNRGEKRSDYRQRCAQNPRVVRGTELRQVLGLPEHGHVLRSRRMRDHLEHFDERLDEWLSTSQHHNYIQDNIGPIGSVAGFEATGYMRWFDPQTNHIWFRGEQHDLQVYAAKVAEIRNVTDQTLTATRASRVRPPQG